jgi:hypothetical protein
MANEFRHKDVIAGRIREIEYEHVNQHILNGQATGDIVYASSASQLSGLVIGATDTILSVQGGVPTWRTPANILTDLSGQAGAAFDWNSQNLTGLGTLNTHTLPGGTDTICLIAATQELDNKTLDSAVGKGTWTTSGVWTLPAITLGGIMTLADTIGINTGVADNDYYTLGADDLGVGIVEVARVAGAADPYFGIGVDGAVLKGTNSGLLGFFGATPVNQPDAYTQTYSTPDRTIANPTGVSMGDLVATNGGWGASTEANFDKITTAVDQLIADNLDLRQAITALIDDLQELGLVG